MSEEVWIHKQEGSEASGPSAEWSLWGAPYAHYAHPWPRDEIERGFQYFICEPARPYGVHIRVRATVTDYLPSVGIVSLSDAYARIEPMIEAAGLALSRLDWLNHAYNVDREGAWPLTFAFWLIDEHVMQPFWIEEIADFKDGRSDWTAPVFCWKRVAADHLPDYALR